MVPNVTVVVVLLGLNSLNFTSMSINVWQILKSSSPAVYQHRSLLKVMYILWGSHRKAGNWRSPVHLQKWKIGYHIQTLKKRGECQFFFFHVIRIFVKPLTELRTLSSHLQSNLHCRKSCNCIIHTHLQNRVDVASKFHQSLLHRFLSLETKSSTKRYDAHKIIWHLRLRRRCGTGLRQPCRSPHKPHTPCTSLRHSRCLLLGAGSDSFSNHINLTSNLQNHKYKQRVLFR